ncbi:MAG: protein kinase [Pirellulales bacterium]|nr:protein kinase [Pirellulales bacterium]
MAISSQQFWQTLASSGLVAVTFCDHLKSQFEASGGGEAKAVASFLINQGVITKYQSRVLLSGQAVPFNYGDYQLLDQVTTGPLSGCLRAVHRPTAHEVILGFLADGTAQTWQNTHNRVARFRAVSSPFFVRVYATEDLGQYRFVTFENTQLFAVKDVLDSTPFPANDLARFGWQLAMGVQSIHEAGVTHGCITINSIGIDQENGNATLFRDTRQDDLLPGHLEASGAEPQNADYLAPELVATGAQPTVQSDIYALGCCLYELACGQAPFSGSTISDKMQLHATQPLTALANAAVSEPLKQLITYMMAKNPSTRFQSVADVLGKLQLLLGDQIPTTSREAPSTEQVYQSVIAANATGSLVATPAAPSAAASSVTTTATTSTPAPRPTAPQVSIVTDEPPQVDEAGNPIPKRPVSYTPKPPLLKNPFLYVGIGFVAILIFVGLSFMGGGNEVVNNDSNNQSSSTKNTNGENTTVAKTDGETTDRGELLGNQILIADDGATPWASPTTGEPLSLEWCPPGAQLFISFRPASFSETEIADPTFQSLGPAFNSLMDQFQATAGFKIGEIDQLLVSMLSNDDAFPRTCVVVRLVEDLNTDDIVEKWGDVAVEESDAGNIYSVDPWTMLIPKDTKSFFVMGDREDIDELVATGGNAPPVLRSMNMLRSVSDRDRHFTLLCVPGFLSTDLLQDSHQFYFGDPKRLRQPLEWLIGDSAEAISFSLHADDVMYLESRFVAGLTDQGDLLTDFVERLNEIPDSIEQFMINLNPPPYWARLAYRYHTMIRTLVDQMRSGKENKLAVINFAVPLHATPNLIAGAELAIASEPGAAITVVTPTGMTPTNMDELLAYKSSVDIPQQDLEFAVKDIEDDIKESLPELDFPFAIKIIGNDLRTDGITRNQAIRDYLATNVSLKEILTGLVLKANPDATEGPADPAQKLIWVIGPDPDDDSRQIILLTTRKAAETKEYELPSVFKTEE